ncbi:mediator of RNA polymerase II transcription subunit 8 [Neophaeococcomyces mojaviensis]|uniref:Mediator of RNA polymerase II transcription subunit 8 n=1 Tax=Neophaeococcomyces mojaviensis TaxID=3383035 RepID=A0ACC3AHU2_9EURO|nr:mediator of RNA polymerase II transcription subunit 8 [Knufia sp. JES_112]
MASFESEGTKIETDVWKVLDRLRARLQLLVGSLTAMQNDLANPNVALPAWPQFQTSMNKVQQEINQVAEQIKQNRETLSNMVLVPDPKFPIRQQHILQTLMRTKMEPSVEDWIEQNLKAAHEKTEEEKRDWIELDRNPLKRLTEDDRRQLWPWAAVTANIKGKSHIWGADFTAAEKAEGCEKIETGLMRPLEEPPTPDPYAESGLDGEEPQQYVEVDVEGADEADKMDLDQTRQSGARAASHSTLARSAIPMENIHRFMTKGVQT